MCNKYRNRAPLSAIQQATNRQLGFDLRLGLNEPIPEEVFPRRPGLILRPGEGALDPSIAHWGLVPFYHKGSFKDWKLSTNNAKSETMGTSPAFREAVKKRRCLIPATSYVEWTGPKGSKTEHDISSPDGLLFMAGLWDRSDAGESYTMVMQDALGEAKRFHSRMPVFLGRETAATWLDLEADWREVLGLTVPLVASPPDPVT